MSGPAIPQWDISRYATTLVFLGPRECSMQCIMPDHPSFFMLPFFVEIDPVLMRCNTKSLIDACFFHLVACLHCLVPAFLCLKPCFSQSGESSEISIPSSPNHSWYRFREVIFSLKTLHISHMLLLFLINFINFLC